MRWEESGIRILCSADLKCEGLPTLPTKFTHLPNRAYRSSLKNGHDVIPGITDVSYLPRGMSAFIQERLEKMSLKKKIYFNKASDLLP